MKTIFIGPCGGGRIPTNGASIKNYHILTRIKRILGDNLIIKDTEFWKTNPLVLISILATIITNRKAKYILSLNNSSAIKMIKVVSCFAPKSSIIYWVIGGSIAKWAKNGLINKECLKIPLNIIVEGESMKKDLNELGIANVSVMPNFKKINNLEHNNNQHGGHHKFIFLSRIIPQKGVLIIFEAIKKLNQLNLSNKFSVDFYGPIDDSFKDEFYNNINTIENAYYKGFIDLRYKENYSILQNYEAMLFPTFWPGEGCPGIVIDAYMANLPIIASDWNLNKDYIIDGETGYIIKPNDSVGLVDSMLKIIQNNNIKNLFKDNIKKELKRFDIDNVLNEINLIKNHII